MSIWPCKGGPNLEYIQFTSIWLELIYFATGLKIQALVLDLPENGM